jgi:HD-GYP domain-containing protein (c-di-GMP phosphodiesterase class II)
VRGIRLLAANPAVMSALLALSEAIEARDPYLRGHSARVARMARAVGIHLGCDEPRLAALELGGALHDLGKLAVAETILSKPGPLTADEVAAVRRHPGVGARLVVLDDQLRAAVPGVLYHHERWDGSGYPRGRARSEIPFEARVLAVVDAFDAMISDRPYRAALTAERAIEEVDRCSGTQFDPEVALGFLETWSSGALEAAASPRAVARASTTPPASSVPCGSRRS